MQPYASAYSCCVPTQPLATPLSTSSVVLIKPAFESPTHRQSPRGLMNSVNSLYRLRNVDESRLQRIATASPASTIGDAVQDTGQLIDLKRVLVPATLREYLGFESIYFLEIERGRQAFFSNHITRAARSPVGRSYRCHGYPSLISRGLRTKAIACGEVGLVCYSTHELR